MVQLEEMFLSLQKSHEKANYMLTRSSSVKSVYKNSRAIRPLIIKVIKFYPYLKKKAEYTEYLQVSYNKCNDWIGKIDSKIISIFGFYLECHHQINLVQANYLKKFLKNLKTLKKLCEETSISYYNSLPGNKIPLDIRTYIISFISPVPM